MRAFLAIAAVAGAIFVFLTPPFEVPDETAHYWRACAIARGVFQPAPQYGQGYTAIPVGERELGIRGGAPVRETRARMREDWAIQYVPERVIVRYPLSLSPLPFLPQALGIAAGNALHLRPMISFYLGRLLNLAACLAIIAWAMRIASGARWILAACAMLPMALFMFASFSPDAMTIAVAFLAIALALVGSPWVIAAALALALCKAYLLIPLLAIAIPSPALRAPSPRRAGRGVLLLATVIAGIFIAGAFSKTTSTFMRPDVDPAKQVAFMKSHPGTAAAIIGKDVAKNGLVYGEQMIGVLGWLTIPLPRAVTFGIIAILLGAALLAGPKVTVAQRVLALILALASIATVEISEYIGWTAVGASTVDGVQGRYFLPILPLLLIAISRNGRGDARWLPYAMGVANAFAIFAVWSRYFRF